MDGAHIRECQCFLIHLAALAVFYGDLDFVACRGKRVASIVIEADHALEIDCLTGTVHGPVGIEQGFCRIAVETTLDAKLPGRDALGPEARANRQIAIAFDQGKEICPHFGVIKSRRKHPILVCGLCAKQVPAPSHQPHRGVSCRLPALQIGYPYQRRVERALDDHVRLGDREQIAGRFLLLIRYLWRADLQIVQSRRRIAASCIHDAQPLDLGLVPFRCDGHRPGAHLLEVGCAPCIPCAPVRHPLYEPVGVDLVQL